MGQSLSPRQLIHGRDGDVMVTDFLEGSRPSHFQVLEAEVRKNSPSNPPPTPQPSGDPQVGGFGKEGGRDCGQGQERLEFVLFS